MLFLTPLLVGTGGPCRVAVAGRDGRASLADLPAGMAWGLLDCPELGLRLPGVGAVVIALI